MMKTKSKMKIIKNNIRKCVLTNERYSRTELLRVVRTENGVEIDITGNRPGRGAYITPNVKIIKQAQKKNAFARSLRMKVDTEIYDELLKVVESNE